jgi:hypothetical protein
MVLARMRVHFDFIVAKRDNDGYPNANLDKKVWNMRRVGSF